VRRLLGWIGLVAGGWIGWGAGARLSLAAAIVLGAVGTGLGLCLARRVAEEYF
jgi:hypothetical protein